MDYSTPEKQAKRLLELVKGYGRNWSALTRLIGGKPREDLQDYIPGQDDGEAPAGATW